MAAALLQPVSASAAGLRKVTRASLSVVITASPMLASVTRNHSRCRWSSASASLETGRSGDSPRPPHVERREPQTVRVPAALLALTADHNGGTGAAANRKWFIGPIRSKSSNVNVFPEPGVPPTFLSASLTVSETETVAGWKAGGTGSCPTGQFKMEQVALFSSTSPVPPTSRSARLPVALSARCRLESRRYRFMSTEQFKEEQAALHESPTPFCDTTSHA